MESKLVRLWITFALALATLGGAIAAPSRTDSRTMAYHGGPVMPGTEDIYLIWYGCWAQPGCGGADARSNDQATVDIVSDFSWSIGGSPYFQINAGYPNDLGQHPSGGLIYGGSVVDRYSRGPTLTEADIAALIADRLVNGDLPQDPTGVYVVFTSSDVTVVDGVTQLCVTCCNFHSSGTAMGVPFRFAVVGNPARCPSGCASQFQGAASPNANFAADAMIAWLAHALNGTVTNPTDHGWYDRYGLENSEKCEGTFGPTQTLTNPDGQSAEFNVALPGGRHYLLQQNWVNDKKGRCALQISQ